MRKLFEHLTEVQTPKIHTCLSACERKKRNRIVENIARRLKEDNEGIYQKLKAMGAEMDSHESDLYVKATPETEEATKNYPNRKFFTSQVDNQKWIELPFAYQPWWDKRVGVKGQASEKTHKPITEAMSAASQIADNFVRFLIGDRKAALDNLAKLIWAETDIELTAKDYNSKYAELYQEMLKVVNRVIFETKVVKEANETELEDWQKKAKAELEKELGVKTKVTDYGAFSEFGAFSLEAVEGEASNGESEWIVFETSEQAEEAALSQIKEDLENEPESFTQDWLQNYIFVSDTDKRIIASEEADAYIDGMDDDEILEEAGLKDEYDAEEDPEKQEAILDRAKDDLAVSKSEEIEQKLDDPIQYFVHDQGIYSVGDLMKQPWIQIDVERAAQDVIKIDGVAHFLDRYDGEEVELPSGAVAYGTN